MRYPSDERMSRVTPSQRQLRAGELIRHALADILLRGETGDPELEALKVSVHEVQVSPDLKIATAYVSTTMHGDPTVFGVNFADGRIKGYGLSMPGRGEKKFYVLYVRGNPDYGRNQFADNGDGRRRGT